MVDADQGQGSTRDVIEKLMKDMKPKNSETDKFSSKLKNDLQRKLDVMDQVTHLLTALILQREHKRQADRQKHKRRLELIKKKTEVYRKVASLVRIASKLKGGKSISEATADLKNDIEKKKERLKGIKDALAQKSAAVVELRQRKTALEAKLKGKSAEAGMEIAVKMRLKINQLNELQSQLRAESDRLNEHVVKLQDSSNCQSR